MHLNDISFSDGPVTRATKATLKPTSYHFLNAFSLYCASQDPDLAAIYRDPATVKYIDSFWLRKALHVTTPSNLVQVRGPEFFDLACSQWTLRHMFIGSTPETLKALELNLLENNSSIVIAAMHSPPFSSNFTEVQESIDRAIGDAKPDLIWLALGTPKQDLEARRLALVNQIPVLAVGAAFDFTAGTFKVAPKAWRALGLEWLFRLIQEPKRLWKRYLLGNAYLVKVTLSSLWPGHANRRRP